MGNDVALFADKSAVPAYLVGNVSQTTKSLAGGEGGIPWISIKGMVFRMMLGSKEVAINEDRSMKFVVVGAAAALARSYYPKYVEGANAVPICWSDDGTKPSEFCETPKASACVSCPMNVKGSGENGSRACKYSARIAVALEGDIGGTVYGMSIPAMSVFGDSDGQYSGLQELVRKLAAHNISVDRIVTEFKFDSKSPVPKLLFRPARPLTKEELEVVEGQSARPEMDSLIGPRKYERRDDEDDAPAEEPTVRSGKGKASAAAASVNVEDTLKEWASDDA